MRNVESRQSWGAKTAIRNPNEPLCTRCALHFYANNTHRPNGCFSPPLFSPPFSLRSQCPDWLPFSLNQWFAFFPLSCHYRLTAKFFFYFQFLAPLFLLFVVSKEMPNKQFCFLIRHSQSRTLWFRTPHTLKFLWLNFSRWKRFNWCYTCTMYIAIWNSLCVCVLCLPTCKHTNTPSHTHTHTKAKQCICHEHGWM